MATRLPPLAKLVTVLKIMLETGPQVSLTMGGSKVRSALPDALVLLAEQSMVGGVVSAVQL